MRTRAAILCLSLLLLGGPSHAGIGHVYDNGNLGVIDLIVELNWFQPNLDYLKNTFTKASELLWDASEGQFRLGTITFRQNSVKSDVADILIEQWDRKPSTNGGLGNIGSKSSHIAIGYQTLLSNSGEAPLIIAHEIGHYALGLADEYRIDHQPVECNAGDYGTCFFDPNKLDGDAGQPMDEHQNNCIMQPTLFQGKASSEFCVPENHDLDRSCGPDNGPIPHESQQSRLNQGKSCFETIAERFSFARIPQGLPQAASPPNFIPPSFVDQRRLIEAIMLVLDRSGSMDLSTESDTSEACNNNKDDDNDGVVDEPDCTGTRLEYLKAAARLFVDMVVSTRHDKVKVGITSFASTASLDMPLRTLNNYNVGQFKSIINGLRAGGQTNAGDALNEAHKELLNQPDAIRMALLFSDGFWNRGPDPVQIAKAMHSDGIHIDTIGTGPAVHSSFLSHVSNETFGYPAYEEDASALPSAFANTWAQIFNHTAIIPKIPFHTNTQQHAPEIPKTHKIPSDTWFTQKGMESIPQGAVINEIEFLVPPNSPSLVVVTAGALGDMTKFDLEGELVSPIGDTCSIGVVGPQPCRVVQDPYYWLLLFQQPVEGTWKLRLWSGGAHAPEQRGFATVLVEGPAPTLRVDVRPKAISVHDTALVDVTPVFGSTLYDLDRLELVVRDPAGSHQSFPLQSTPDGAYRAEIHNLQYHGLHQVSILARSGTSTFCGRGETWIRALPPCSHVPIFEIGTRISFGTIDGVLAGEPIGDGVP